MAIQEIDLQNRFVVGEFTEPARLLQEQAQAIHEEYNGVLFGTVWKDTMPPRNGVAYFLDVGIQSKPFRFAPIFMRHNMRNPYPVIVVNTLESAKIKVYDAEAFKQKVQAILHDPEIRAQFARMVDYAKEP